MGFVQEHSVHSRAPSGSSGSFVSVRSIPVRPGDCRVRSCAFSPFPYALEVAIVRWVHSRAPWGASCSFVRVWSVAVHTGVRSGAFGPFLCALCIVGCIMSISVCHCARLGAFGPFTRALAVLGFVRVRSVHSRAH